MPRLGGNGVNTQKHNKITPKVEKPPFLGLKNDFTKSREYDIVTIDRIREMCEQVEVKGDNWR